jgi:hypothetical protein
MVAPNSVRAARWRFVKGDSHMSVFMAGAIMKGLRKSQALTTHVTRLSHKPCIQKTRNHTQCQQCTENHPLSKCDQSATYARKRNELLRPILKEHS